MNDNTITKSVEDKIISGVKEVGKTFFWWGMLMVLSYFVILFCFPSECLKPDGTKKDYAVLWGIVFGCLVIDGTCSAFVRGFEKK